MIVDGAWDGPMLGESAKAFAAFCAYRDLGAQRSVRSAFRRATSSTAQRPGGTWSNWAARFDWVTRARGFDLALDREQRATAAEAVRLMAIRHANMAGVFQRKVIDRLNSFTEKDVAELSPAEMIRWFEVAIKVERQARGLQEESKVNLTVVFARAKELAEQYGVDVQDILDEAERIVEASGGLP